nr:hypothetical protein [Tanacetum cinerariifolium]
DHCKPLQYTVNHLTFNAHNDLPSSRTTLMEQMTTLTSMCEMVCQIIQKKQEEKRIEDEQAANARYWKIPACCDDDDDYNYAITPVLSTEEPVDSPSMGDEHLDTIPETESDKVIKSSVEDLVPIPGESKGIPDTMCDVHFVNNPTHLEAKDHFEIVINSKDDIPSSDDNSLYNKNNDTTTHSDISLSDYEAFYFNDDHIEEISSGSTTTHSDISLSDYEAFYFNDDHIEEISSGSTTTHSDISLSEYDSFILDFLND